MIRALLRLLMFAGLALFSAGVWLGIIEAGRWVAMKLAERIG
jgi:hypothetical protein